MGAVSKFPYPKHTWSPAGGWWNEPKNWKTRTGVLVGVLGLLIHKTTYSHLPATQEE
ncbi:hypothetical protein SPRG_13208 [Saprolegnia parasitica CBS 223.65]|uniref:Uncharacterized protein n=1 Tax=Saprolegnia parasitica (strain CBS 223.65) TaxID=695850 RepID=A0A067C445_SAPPC|nr:hypothetical protein SPRG_13208 [Saprolegnia parasitica CBS 223.65]KDO21316.1 hypothetical protein SPRG_13208 [Saprolegnia parasitica CBS 223.65]|eukprot:XP_012207972.1 hypothetical protein SPRG_13208 [Saprolegnia parasitica CBS 223.65]